MLSILLLLFTTLIASTTSTPLSTRATCPSYIIIEAPGLGDWGGSWTGPTSAGILSGLAGGERHLLQTQPPGDDGPNTDALSIAVGGTEGANEIVTTIAQQTLACPGVKFVIIGYSYGTIEAVLAMNDPAILRPAVSAVLLFGNCFWHAGKTENRGTATSGTSVCGGQAGLGTPPLFEDITADFCLVNDYLCTGTPYAAKNNAHWDYKNSQWQGQAVSYAISRLKATGLDIPGVVQ